MEGWDSTKKLFERISTDRIDENGTRKPLPLLAAKYGLSDRDIIECFTHLRSDLLEVRKEQGKRTTLSCGFGTDVDADFLDK